MAFTAQRNDDRDKRTSDHAQTRDLCSNTEFQSHGRPVPVTILRPPSLNTSLSNNHLLKHKSMANYISPIKM